MSMSINYILLKVIPIQITKCLCSHGKGTTTPSTPNLALTSYIETSTALRLQYKLYPTQNLMLNYFNLNTLQYIK